MRLHSQRRSHRPKAPFLFGSKPGMADAMFAPVVTCFITYDVKLDSDCAAYCKAIMALPPMQEWLEGAQAEPDEMVGAGRGVLGAATRRSPSHIFSPGNLLACFAQSANWVSSNASSSWMSR